ncbi:50S ribosomal protein L4 [Candidatus Woesearchaeota archaeon]|nr:50S ribosomal protein L4 [Candidatus Woesearchaeota archaeon]
MELKILSLTKQEIGKKKLPKQFDEPVRKDLIQKVVRALQSNKRQPYGAFPRAGKRASAKISRRRHDYKTAYGYGISRVPRKILSRRGTRFNWVGAFAPGTVGGRRTHPPKAEKIWSQKINKKENRKAIRSAISATLSPELVKQRGHNVPEGYPFIIESKFEGIKKAKEVQKALAKLGLAEEMERASKRKVRAGRGKSRGRKYKTKKGPLLVVSSECSLIKACGAIPGIEVVNVKKINAELLAPGTHVGRLTLFTDKAIESMEKDKLFM